MTGLAAVPALGGGLFTPPWPMSYLKTFGPRADPVTSLGWGLLILSCSVIVIVTVLVPLGIVLRRERRRGRQASAIPVTRGPGGLRWIYIGLSLTLVALVGSLVWTVEVVAEVNSPPAKPAVVIEVTGHQWWWEATYDPDNPARTFATANELHVPVGRPVLIRLVGADVIHSFWIPALTGKTDAIPGRTNVTWLQADRAGIYRGQCTEYCGLQHAGMALYVIADPPERFNRWRQEQLQPAPAAATPSAAQGAQVFAGRCAACHTIRGSDAGGLVGPDLTHLMSRRTIAAGVVANSPAALSGWVANPQALKPGTLMPPTYLSGPQLAALRSYLETLR